MSRRAERRSAHKKSPRPCSAHHTGRTPAWGKCKRAQGGRTGRPRPRPIAWATLLNPAMGELPSVSLDPAAKRLGGLDRRARQPRAVGQPAIRRDHAHAGGVLIGAKAAIDLVVGGVAPRPRGVGHLDDRRADRRARRLLEDDGDVLAALGDPALEHVHQPDHRPVTVLPPVVGARSDHVHAVDEVAHPTGSLRPEDVGSTTMDGEQKTLDEILVGDRERWKDGPPHELFKRLRGECPVHWSSQITDYPEEEGFWSVTTADDVHEVSHDWQTYSSERGGITALTNAIMPLELIQSMFIGMDPPKHDRLKMLFQRGFTPKRIAEHEDAIRAITVGVLERLDGRETCDLVTEVAQPVVSRVIGSFMGIPPEDDEIWARLMNATLGAGDPDLNPEGVETVMKRDVPEIFERCGRLIAERRERPTDDLTSVLVHAEIDGERLEEHEIVMGFFLLMAAGNDSTKATYSSGMRALLENPDQRRLLLDDPSLIPSAVEESLRMFPAFAHFRRTATRDVELDGQTIHEGEKVVMWYVSSNRDETRYEDPDRFDVTRNPEHQAFGAGGRHFCLGTALARLELRILLEETLARFPEMELAGRPEQVESPFVNQLKALPVRLRP